MRKGWNVGVCWHATAAMSKETYSRPSDVIAVDGKVLIDGPDHIDIAMTPEAAAETGSRLIDQAARAAGQEREALTDYRPK